jgi:1,4-alpha-glucan branching enzyme
MVKQLNALYRAEPALHQIDFTPEGFEWIVADDTVASVIAFLRKSHDGSTLLVACNFTPVPREHYQVGVPHPGHWQEVLNSDATEYGGSGWGNLGGVHAQAQPRHGKPHTLSLTLPPLSTVVLKWSSHVSHPS